MSAVKNYLMFDSNNHLKSFDIQKYFEMLYMFSIAAYICRLLIIDVCFNRYTAGLSCHLHISIANYV